MENKESAGLSGRRLSTYKDFRALDNLNRKLWRSKYIERTGRGSGRGWTKSKEYERYLKSRKKRGEKLREENPSAYFRNVNAIETRPDGGYYKNIDFSGVEVWNGVLEIIPRLEAWKVAANRVGKRYEPYMYFGGRLFTGFTTIQGKLKDLADKWRKMAERKRKRQNKYNLFFLEGGFTTVEYSGIVSTKIVLNINRDSGDEQDDF